MKKTKSIEVTERFCDICEALVQQDSEEYGKCHICRRDVCGEHTKFVDLDSTPFSSTVCPPCMEIGARYLLMIKDTTRAIVRRWKEKAGGFRHDTKPEAPKPQAGTSDLGPCIHCSCWMLRTKDGLVCSRCHNHGTAPVVPALTAEDAAVIEAADGHIYNTTSSAGWETYQKLYQAVRARRAARQRGAGQADCDHTGIGQPGCPTCDPRTKSEGGPRCSACERVPCRCDPAPPAQAPGADNSKEEACSNDSSSSCSPSPKDSGSDSSSAPTGWPSSSPAAPDPSPARSPEPPSPGSVWRHFKGGVVTVLNLARNTASGSGASSVVYDHDGVIWVRPLLEWHDHIDRDGYSGPRFQPVQAPARSAEEPYRRALEALEAVQWAGKFENGSRSCMNCDAPAEKGRHYFHCCLDYSMKWLRRMIEIIEMPAPSTRSVKP